jgi:hypothetical protein
MAMLHSLKAFIPAVILAYLVASVLVTQANLAAVQSMGLEVGAGVRLDTTLKDILGMASSYLILILVSFALAIPVAARLARFLPAQRTLLFTLAGFVAIVSLHLIMQAVLGVSGIAPTRTLAGLLSQGLAGVVGGFCYAHVSSRG